MTSRGATDLSIPACEHCGSRESRPVVIRPDGLTVMECRGCGLACIHPQPRQGVGPFLYESRPDESAPPRPITLWSSTAAAVRPADRALARRIARQRLQWVLSLLPAKSPKRVLEVGCGRGEFAAAAKQRGVPITAIDESAAAIRLARQTYPWIDFRVNDVRGLFDSGLTFDAVVAHDVIARQPDPRDWLQACQTLLSPGGVVVVTAANYRLARVHGAEWTGFRRDFENVYFFSDETLARQGAAAGLEPLTWKTTVGRDVLAGPPSVWQRTLQRAGWLAAWQSLVTHLQALTVGERYEDHGSGPLLLMAFRKPMQSAARMRSAA